VSRTDVETVVVGAGPAGAAAAAHLARAGREVLLVERADLPRDKTCGDGLTAGALRELDRIGLNAETVASWRWIDDTVFVSPAGKWVELDTSLARGRRQLAIAARADLDAALIELAREAGSGIWAPARVTAVRTDDDGLRVDFENRASIRCRTLVAADGAWSPVRRSLEGSGTPRLTKWHASRIYLRHIEGPAADRAVVWFDADLLPGYAWSFPLGDGRVNLGVGALRNAGEGGGWIVRRTEELLRAPAARELVGDQAVVEGSPSVWPIPTEMSFDRLSAGDGRVLFVGDAADATDPMTGEGIAEALITGRLAADAVASGQPDTYPAAAWRALGSRHRRRERCSRLLRSRLLAEWGLRVASANAWTRRQFTGWVFS
jgi:menaquinone-9 beta-reductase